MASSLYNNAKELFANGDIDWTNDDIRVLLVTSSYTPDIDAHDFVDDITNELSGTGYVRKALDNQAVVQNNTNDRAELNADNVTWTGINAGTPTKAVVYKHVTNDADSPLIGWCEFTATATNGGDFTLKWNNGATSGTLFRLT